MLACDTDLTIYDAKYARDDARSKQGSRHSAPEIPGELVRQAGAFPP